LNFDGKKNGAEPSKISNQLSIPQASQSVHSV